MGGRAPRSTENISGFIPQRLFSIGHVALDARGSSSCSSLSWHLRTRGAVSSDAPQPRPYAGGGARPARPRALHPAEPPAGPPFPVTWGRCWLLSCCLTPALEDPVVSSLVS